MISEKISFGQQATAVEFAADNVLPVNDMHVVNYRATLKEAAATLRDLSEGKFVTDGQFRTPNPIWDDMTKPCPRCGIRFEFIAGGGGGK